MSEEINILVVDDSKTDRKILSKTCESAGYKVYEASNGMDAIDVAISNTISLIFMDINMPGVNGIEATEKIKELTGDDIAIVAVSDESRELYSQKSNGIKPFHNFIEKPVRSNDIVSTIKRYLF